MQNRSYHLHNAIKPGTLLFSHLKLSLAIVTGINIQDFTI